MNKKIDEVATEAAEILKEHPQEWFKENAVELKDEDFIRCII